MMLALQMDERGNQSMVEKTESILNQAADRHSFIFYPQMSFFMIQTIWTV